MIGAPVTVRRSSMCSLSGQTATRRYSLHRRPAASVRLLRPHFPRSLPEMDAVSVKNRRRTAGRNVIHLAVLPGQRPRTKARVRVSNRTVSGPDRSRTTARGPGHARAAGAPRQGLRRPGRWNGRRPAPRPGVRSNGGAGAPASAAEPRRRAAAFGPRLHRPRRSPGRRRAGRRGTAGLDPGRVPLHVLQWIAGAGASVPALGAPDAMRLPARKRCPDTSRASFQERPLHITFHIRPEAGGS